MNLCVKQWKCGNHCVFSDMMAPAVAAGGPVFPRALAPICRSCQQNVRKTVARAGFAEKHVKNTNTVGPAPDLCAGDVRPEAMSIDGACVRITIRSTGKAQRFCGAPATRGCSWRLLNALWQL